jgi:hypothetical protein
MPNQNHRSVTDVPCTCGALERFRDDPNYPIELDPDTNLYSFVFPNFGRKSPLVFYGTIAIWHCFFCGGATPELIANRSRTGISVDEIRRLNELLQDIKTLDEAISKLGIPQYDYPATSSEDIERYGLVASTRLHRMLIYENLSETAIIQITDFGLSRTEIRVKIKSGLSTTGDPPHPSAPVS